MNTAATPASMDAKTKPDGMRTAPMAPPWLRPGLVGLTVETAPTVGDGAGRSAPFIAMACDERAAKPTAAGLERYTE